MCIADPLEGEYRQLVSKEEKSAFMRKHGCKLGRASAPGEPGNRRGEATIGRSEEVKVFVLQQKAEGLLEGIDKHVNKVTREQASRIARTSANGRE